MPRPGENVPKHTGMTRVIQRNLAALKAWPHVFPNPEHDRLERATTTTHERIKSLLAARVSEGRVRQCHGDLHLRNLCLFDGRPTLFDAIEFDDDMSCIDVFYDVAFFFMELDHRRLAAVGNLAFNRYLQRTEDYRGLRALPPFLSVRAVVRAMVGMQAAA